MKLCEKWYKSKQINLYSNKYLRTSIILFYVVCRTVETYAGKWTGMGNIFILIFFCSNMGSKMEKSNWFLIDFLLFANLEFSGIMKNYLQM